MFTKHVYKIAVVAAIAAVAIATAHGASQSFRGEQRVVLTPKAGTPCMSACDDPASPSCQSCCRTVTHETDWGCQATDGSPTTASCCTGDWDATCWNVASTANNDHACNQCEGGHLTGGSSSGGSVCGGWHSCGSWLYDDLTLAPSEDNTTVYSSMRQGTQVTAEDLSAYFSTRLNPDGNCRFGVITEDCDKKPGEYLPKYEGGFGCSENVHECQCASEVEAEDRSRRRQKKMFLLGYLVFGFGTLCACYYTCSIKYGNEFGLVDYLNQFRGCGKTEFFYTPLELGPTVFIFTILYGLALGLFVFGFYGVDLDQFWISTCSQYDGRKLGASTRDSRGIKPGYTNHTVGIIAVSVAISLKLGGIAAGSLICPLQSAPRTALCPLQRAVCYLLTCACPVTSYHLKVYGKILTVIDYTIYEETAAGTAAAHFGAVLMILLSAFPIAFFGFAKIRTCWREEPEARKARKAHEAKVARELHGQECLEREAEAQLKAGSEMKKVVYQHTEV